MATRLRNAIGIHMVVQDMAGGEQVPTKSFSHEAATEADLPGTTIGEGAILRHLPRINKIKSSEFWVLGNECIHKQSNCPH